MTKSIKNDQLRITKNNQLSIKNYELRDKKNRNCKFVIRNSDMKPSNIDWLGDIPAGWEVIPIWMLFFMGRGRVISNEEILDNPGEYPVYSSQTENNGNLGGLATYDFDGDYITWTTDGANAGTVFNRSGKFNCTNVCGTLKTKKLKDVDLRFFTHALNVCTKIFVRYDINPKLMNNVIAGIRVQVPPIKDQKDICNFLDCETAKIDEMVAKKQKMMELLKEKRQALITHAVTGKLSIKNYELRDKKNRNCKFVIRNSDMKPSGIDWLGDIPAGWGVRRIKMLCNVSRGASPRPIDDEKYFNDNGEYSWVRIADLTASDRYLEMTTQKLSNLGKSLSVPLEPGEIFLSIAGTVGSPIITKIKCCIHDGFVYFMNLKYNRELLWYIFIAGEAYKGLGKLGTQLNLNTDTVGNISIPVMSEKEQKEIVAFLDRETAKIDEMMKKVEMQIEKLQEYRQALITSAVTGKIKIN